MNRSERRAQKRLGKESTRRKLPITIPAVVGMLESSAHLDERAREKRKEEAQRSGVTRSEKMEWHGQSYDVVDLPSDSLSLGITLSAQILAGQAAELAIKYVYQVEHPTAPPLEGHFLDDLFLKLSSDRRGKVEEDYGVRMRHHGSQPIPGWGTAQEVFRAGRKYPVLFRYATEEGQSPYEVQPIFLREAVCSVLASIGTNVSWEQVLPES